MQRLTQRGTPFPLALPNGRFRLSKMRSGKRRELYISTPRRRPCVTVGAVQEVEGQILDTVVPVLFVVATVALSVVTLGVLYLNISSWWESRSAPKPRKTTEYDEKMKEFISSSGGPRSNKRGKKSVKKATDKGFGP